MRRGGAEGTDRSGARGGRDRGTLGVAGFLTRLKVPQLVFIGEQMFDAQLG